MPPLLLPGSFYRSRPSNSFIQSHLRRYILRVNEWAKK